MVKTWVKRRWPRLPLRAYLFASFFLVAALPGFGAVFLRVYENALVRQTEAALAGTGAALAATAAADWPAGSPGRAVAPEIATADPDNPYGPSTPRPREIDLSASPILPERPPPLPTGSPAPEALAAAARLRPVLAATRVGTLASILLLDAQGRILDGSKTGGDYADLPEVAAAAHGRPATVLRRNGAYRATYRFDWLARAAALRVHLAEPIVVDGRVVGVLLLSRSARALFFGLWEDGGKIAAGIVAILLALVFLSGLLSRGIARPLEELARATRGLATGRGAAPAVPPTAAAEIQDLYRDFATMGNAIERRSAYLRDFAHAVSHEFKTPLAGIRGAVELLQDHGEAMSPAERSRFLANVDAGAARLNSLTSRLLELARADMNTEETAQCDAVTVARTVADAVRGPGFIGWVEADGPAWARISADTLETVLMTLAANSRQAGATRWTVAAGPGPDVILHCTDDGPGVPPADRERIFEPFFTSRRAEGGTGLGLSIARSLLAASGAELNLVDDGGGAAFELRLSTAATPVEAGTS